MEFSKLFANALSVSLILKLYCRHLIFCAIPYLYYFFVERNKYRYMKTMSALQKQKKKKRFEAVLKVKVLMSFKVGTYKALFFPVD